MKTYPVLLMVLFFCAHRVDAQPPDMEDSRGFERIEQFKKVRLIEMLNLKEEQSVRFFARLNEHDSNKRDIMKEKMDALDKIERLVRNHADDKEFDQVFAQVDAAETKISDERRRFFNGLSDLLSAEQRGKLLLFERHFERELREAMKEVQKRRHRMDEQ